MRKRKIDLFSDEQFCEIILTSTSYTEALRKLGYSGGGNSNKVLKERIEKLGLDTSHFNSYTSYSFSKKKLENEEWFIKNCNRDNKSSKKRLLEMGVANKCAICGLLPVWNNQTLILQLDHIDGDNTNNEISNLRLVCPNCHTQTETFCNRNKNVYSPKCLKCNQKISGSGKTGLCISCSSINRRRFKDRPSKSILLKQVESIGYVATGKMYNVSDNTIRKWLKI